MADLKLVPSTDAEEHAVILLRNGYISLEDIGRQTGIGRQRLRSLQATHDPKRRNKIRTGEKRATAILHPVAKVSPIPTVKVNVPSSERGIRFDFWGYMATLIGAGLA